MTSRDYDEIFRAWWDEGQKGPKTCVRAYVLNQSSLSENFLGTILWRLIEGLVSEVFFCQNLGIS